jgi:L-lactate dehydrogenase complex protein LldG
MSARDEILASIRSRLGREGTQGAPNRDDTGPPPRPMVGDDLVGHFTTRAEAIAATVEVVESPSRLPLAIARYLESKGLAPEITTGADPWLAAMPWADSGIEVALRHPREAGLVGVSHASSAIAETGTVVLASGPDNPVTLNYLADYHIVVVERSRVVAFQEEVWTTFRERGLPRALCCITGPSRTGDIEFDIQLGAHGPRNLHVIVVAAA